MATKNRPSVQKREREQKKRDRRLRKAAKAAEKRATPPLAEGQDAPAGAVPLKDGETCLP